MPSGYGPWQAENHGRGGVLLGLLLLVLALLGAGVYWLLADTMFLPVAISVVSVLCVAGTLLAVRNVLRDRGRLWRGESESLLVQALSWRPAKRVGAIPVPELNTAPVRVAIEAPRPVLTGVVVERELARVTSEQEG